jgi:hypothetical protein
VLDQPLRELAARNNRIGAGSVEAMPEMDAPAPGSGRPTRRCAPCVLAIFFGAAPHAVAAATYWQIQQPHMSVLVEGDIDTAKRVAATTSRLRSAASWLLSWPDGTREPPVLVIVVNERLLRRTFEYHNDPLGPFSDPTTGHESWVRTPSLVVVTAHMGRLKGQELRSLQHAYGEALLRAEPSHDWPACVHVGMSPLFAQADLTPPNRFHLSGEKIFVPDRFRALDDKIHGVTLWNPERFLVAANAPQERLPDWDRELYAYSCYLLSYMMASAAPEQRMAMERMLTAVGRGAPLDATITSELQQTPAQFAARYREFGNSVQQSPDFHEIWVDIPEQIPDSPEPIPISAVDVQALLGQLCAKLHNCRK